MVSEQPPTGPQLAKQITLGLRSMLPKDWKVDTLLERQADRGADFWMTVEAPDGARTTLIVEVKRNPTGKSIGPIVQQLRASAEKNRMPDATLVVAAPYLSPAARQRIREQGAGYFDTTGNIWVESRQPAMYIRREGASKDPWPSEDALRSLRGRGTGRALRALLDYAPPFGVRELAERAGVPLGTLSRTIDLLDNDGLLSRSARGPVTGLDWEGVIRRWANDYDVRTSNRITSYLEPRGLTTFSRKLEGQSDYAATGSLAAQRFAAVAPTRLASIYTADADSTAERLQLTATESGANVWLLEPYDDVVFERTSTRDGLVCVSAPQLAVDLLSGPGRDPSEGEELLAWMRGNGNAWRA